MVTLGTLDRGTCTQVSQIIGLLQAPGRTFMYLGDREWGSLFEVHSAGHPLKPGKLKV